MLQNINGRCYLGDICRIVGIQAIKSCKTSYLYVVIKQYGSTVKVGIAPKMTHAPKIAAQKKQPISISHNETYLY